MPTTYFISGHLDLTAEELVEHYVPRLEVAVAGGARFVVGDARGCDARAQAWLAGKQADVTVFHMFEHPRNWIEGFPKRGGFQSDEDRDVAMTLASDDDIAWIRPGREKSGTARNLGRRIRQIG